LKELVFYVFVNPLLYELNSIDGYYFSELSTMKVIEK